VRADILSGRLPRQSGVMLIEALVGILIFAIGILGLVGVQASALRTAQDARYRTEAVNYANDLLSQILVNVDRTNATTLATSLTAFQHQPGGTNCAYSGSASTNAVVTNWAALVAGTTGVTPPSRLPLPGTTATMVQVLVDTSAGAYNRITISVCWKAPNDPVARRHQLVSYIT
jgi:type IV pilus assembly protein PilV